MKSIFKFRTYRAFDCSCGYRFKFNAYTPGTILTCPECKNVYELTEENKAKEVFSTEKS